MGKSLLNCRKECVIKADKSQIKSYFSCQDLHWTLFLSKGRVSCQVSDIIPIHYSRRFWARSQVGFTKGTDLRLPLKSVSIPESRSLGVKLCSSDPSFSKNHWKKKKSKHTHIVVCGSQSTLQRSVALLLFLSTEYLISKECRGIQWESGCPASWWHSCRRGFCPGANTEVSARGLKGTRSTRRGVWLRSLSATVLRWWRSGYFSKEMKMAD